jgi:hypothetical protein
MYMFRPLTTAVALALAAAFSNFAAAGEGPSTSQVVTTRADQDIYQQYGRDSVYAFSVDRKPLKPEQTASRNANPVLEGCC